MVEVKSMHHDPYPGSRAEYILFREKLRQQDDDFQKELNIREQLKSGKTNKTILRKIFFKKIRRKYGCLVCEICGKRNLIRAESGCTIGQHNMATIDHKIPLSEGGFKYTFSNWICACWLCNFKKDNRRAVKTNKGYLVL